VIVLEIFMDTPLSVLLNTFDNPIDWIIAVFLLFAGLIGLINLLVNYKPTIDFRQISIPIIVWKRRDGHGES
jgi:hypothetical protein